MGPSTKKLDWILILFYFCKYLPLINGQKKFQDKITWKYLVVLYNHCKTGKEWYILWQWKIENTNLCIEKLRSFKRLPTHIKFNKKYSNFRLESKWDPAFQIRFRTGVPLFTEHLQEALLLLGRSAFLPCHGCAGRPAGSFRGGDVTIISSTTVQYLLFVSIPFNYCLQPYFAPGISKRERPTLASSPKINASTLASHRIRDDTNEIISS